MLLLFLLLLFVCFLFCLGMKKRKKKVEETTKAVM